MVYRNGNLERIHTPEGYVLTANSNSNNWQYIYHIKDYQGNVRVEAESGFISNNTGISPCTPRYLTDYYPLGMELTPKSGLSVPNPAPPNLYSGNELERTDIQLYDFHARQYDQQLGRFMTIDPLAALDYSVSPYVYCNGDPINYIDPLGLIRYWPEYGTYGPDEEVVVTAKSPDSKKKEEETSGGGSSGGGGGSVEDNFSIDNEWWLASAAREKAQRMEIEGFMKEQNLLEGDKSGLSDKVNLGSSVVVVLESLHPSCDKEALRVVKLMPKWTPGKQDGNPVLVYFTIPIRFKFPGERRMVFDPLF